MYVRLQSYVLMISHYRQLDVLEMAKRLGCTLICDEVPAKRRMGHPEMR